MIDPCSKYYGASVTAQAVNYLKQWYIDQEFDDDDFINDWIPNDFENRDGIHVFTNKLSRLLSNDSMDISLNSERNKRIIFN